MGQRGRAMNKENLIILAIILGAILIIGLGLKSYIFTQIPLLETSTATNAYPPIISGTTKTGDVVIELVPLGVIDGLLQVEASFNTHSVDLDQFDLKTSTRLMIKQKEINPVAVPVLQRHHASGAYAFPVTSVPKEFIITITGIPAERLRTFQWS